MKNNITALFAGLLMGLGLTISTMVDPQRVLGFLDLLGQWDPTLIFVMGGGLAVYMPLYFLLIHNKNTTAFGTPCDLPSSKQIDKPLVVGAILFGVGWGLSGICPGPALVNISGGATEILIFVVTMLIGMIVGARIKMT
ncbi:YeeE/YedE family protein [Aliiglaciecola sp. M165]|uniref:YeeE/YedE family protein n=1 Tax=Aliiglaciecola sp. M165 TaxID=2593649 RepID=UPI00117DE587|nr:YeeE/YedE family protein [Aliiglaciecola sp. M165]TRY33308.1 YeeE/YedE family protein [Aliiglaciecola sp. M165]